jgi:hypothetical protein
MCFSASVSFGAGAVLAGTGIIAIKKNKLPGMLALASTPMIFSFHQISEGFLWLALKNPEFSSWYKPALYAYSFISQPFWPIWVPLFVWLMEPDKGRKKMLSYFLLLGGFFSLFMLYCTIVFDISAVAESGHIRFYRDFPVINLIRTLYFVTVIIPPFLSSLRYMKLLAGATLGALILSFIFFNHYLISVWCFFAAILSVLVFLVIAGNKEPVRVNHNQ